ncbi:Na+/H+ antiporter NhaA [Nitrospina watsonii]|uniref:Na(+)/H(+) antiporter NhaA n=1 Tax=Nitrospina watsonii TaxID=1323948 RepID=A0ABM9HGP3_9BACT|nr:Na+/H+ antiporter NhaA [Nitrospina watsonii]CAI2719499.1 Na(+):H(+) antiporter NhaA [Nitrospina watsonii]
MLHKLSDQWKRFVKWKASGGALLFFAAMLAVALANTPLHDFYNELIHTPVEIRIGGFAIAKPFRIWVNDGLMAAFFLLVGLEIKREVVGDPKHSTANLMFPGVAAVGGMAAPALVYIWINQDDSVAMQGWAIPAATDIAFALAILSLVGPAVPRNLKMFLMSLAVLDDLGAIVVIALFYTNQLSPNALLMAGAAFLTLIWLNRSGINHLMPYMLVGVLLWVFVLKSGVHATLAGVLVAFTIPIGRPKRTALSPCRRLEKTLHPWVTYGTLPLFAFVNSGLPLSEETFQYFTHPVTLGIMTGLVLGKPLGIFGFSWIAAKTGLVTVPSKITMMQIFGVSLLCGIGFTMSLFIGSLAFDLGGLDDTGYVRLGILTGSLISGVLGFTVLRAVLHQK